MPAPDDHHGFVVAPIVREVLDAQSAVKPEVVNDPPHTQAYVRDPFR